MRKYKTKNSTEIAIANAISNLCIPILQQHKDKISGIYLSPFYIGENQKIQIVFARANNTELGIEKKITTVNRLQIFVSEENIKEYKIKPKTDSQYKLARDLKTGIILYDVYGQLFIKKEILNIDSEIIPFCNTFELSDSLEKMVKSKIHDYKKNGKN